MEKFDSVLFFTIEKLIKVYRKFAHEQIKKNGYDITIDQWLVLRCLQENKILSQSQVAEMLFKLDIEMWHAVRKQKKQGECNESHRM